MFSLCPPFAGGGGEGERYLPSSRQGGVNTFQLTGGGVHTFHPMGGTLQLMGGRGYLPKEGSPPPLARVGTPPPIASNCYVAGGMPLAFT